MPGAVCQSIARFSLAIFSVLALGFQNAQAQDRTVFGEGAKCLQGDCTNGLGTIQTFNGNKYTGVWSNGRPNGSTYQVEWAIDPGKQYELSMDGAGRPLKGTVPRGAGAVYSGTFKQFVNPFTKTTVSSYDKGTYSIDGYKYEGQFDYIPELQKNPDSFGRLELKDSSPNLQIGRFIFVGARIDENENEVLQGIFASEAVVPHLAIRFFRATPAHLMRLRENLVIDKEVQAQEEREAQAAAKSRAELWAQLFQVAAGVAVAYGEYRLQESAQRAALASISDATAGRKTPEGATRALLADVPSFDKSGKLSYSQQQLRDIGQQKARTTVADYRAAQSAAQNTGPHGGSVAMATGATAPVTAGSPANNSGGGVQTKPSATIAAGGNSINPAAGAVPGGAGSTLPKPVPPASQTSASCMRISGTSPVKKPDRADYMNRVPAAASWGACWGTRELGLKFARIGVTTDASHTCRAIGPGWVLEEPPIVAGLEGCTLCKDGREFKCMIEKATYNCFNSSRYDADKRAYDRYERDVQQCERDNARK